MSLRMIFIKIMLGFILPFMLCGISYNYISENFEKYNAYAKSEDIINVEATVSKVYKSDIKRSRGKNRGFDIVGTEYYYTMLYIVNNHEYKDTLTEKSYYNNPIKPMKIGDKKIIEVYKDNRSRYNGIYKIPKIKNIKELHSNNSTFYIFITFAVIMCILSFFLKDKKDD